MLTTVDELNNWWLGRTATEFLYPGGSVPISFSYRLLTQIHRAWQRWPFHYPSMVNRNLNISEQGYQRYLFFFNFSLAYGRILLKVDLLVVYFQIFAVINVQFIKLTIKSVNFQGSKYSKLFPLDEYINLRQVLWFVNQNLYCHRLDNLIRLFWDIYYITNYWNNFLPLETPHRNNLDIDIYKTLLSCTDELHRSYSGITEEVFKRLKIWTFPSF